MARTGTRFLLRTLGLIGLGGAIYLALRGLDTAGLRGALAEARLAHLALAMPLFAASYALRGVRWTQLFPAEVRARGVRHAGGILLIGFLLNNLLPARGGELARVVLMGRHNKLPASGTLATLFAERVFDGFMLGLVGLASLQALVGEELRWLRHVSLGFCCLFAGLLGLAFFQRNVARWTARVAARFPGHLSLAASRSVGSALDYLSVLASSRALLRVTLLTVLIWTLEIAVYAIVARAFGAQLALARAGGVLSAINFASLAPTPGGVGAVEVAGTLTLTASGLPRETAFVIVTAQHALQYAFCLVAGLFFAGRLGFTWSTQVVAPFRAMCDLELMLATPAPIVAGMAERLRAVRAGEGPQISVVIPAYNEAQRILPTLLAMIEHLQPRFQHFEIVVVDDGSKDATADVVQQLGRRVGAVRLICLPSNLGKGAAVRAGMRSARGELILFADADGATPAAELERLLPAIDAGADVAIGSRALAARDTHVARTLKRAVVGRTFAFLVNSWVVPGIADTQCGFKLFRRAAARHIFDLQQLDGFAFDVELLKLASVLDYRVQEVAINWADQAGSKVSIVSDSLRMLWDVVRVPYLGSVTRAAGSLSALAEREAPSSEPS